MTKNGLKIILPILILSVPITPICAQGQAAVTDESAGTAKDKTRFVTTSKELGEVLSYNGYDFKTETYDGKEVLVVDVDGITTIVQFFGGAPEFESVQFYAGFLADSSSTVQRMNEWNSTYRFTRAYIDAEGDPALEMDLNFTFGGISERQLEDSLALWELSVVTFHKFIYEKGKADDKTMDLLKKLRDI